MLFSAIFIITAESTEKVCSERDDISCLGWTTLISKNKKSTEKISNVSLMSTKNDGKMYNSVKQLPFSMVNNYLAVWLLPVSMVNNYLSVKLLLPKKIV